jgi:hypothetical protein
MPPKYYDATNPCIRFNGILSDTSCNASQPVWMVSFARGTFFPTWTGASTVQLRASIEIFAIFLTRAKNVDRPLRGSSENSRVIYLISIRRGVILNMGSVNDTLVPVSFSLVSAMTAGPFPVRVTPHWGTVLASWRTSEDSCPSSSDSIPSASRLGGAVRVRTWRPWVIPYIASINSLPLRSSSLSYLPSWFHIQILRWMVFFRSST